jgi:hypothetical protein
VAKKKPFHVVSIENPNAIAQLIASEFEPHYFQFSMMSSVGYSVPNNPNWPRNLTPHNHVQYIGLAHIVSGQSSSITLRAIAAYPLASGSGNRSRPTPTYY